MTMKKYRVSIVVHATLTVYVMAENEEQAVQLALDQGEPGLCFPCASRPTGGDEGDADFSIDALGSVNSVTLDEDE